MDAGKETTMLLSLVEYIFLGFLFMGLSLPLIQRRVKPNPWYGFRTRKTLSEARIWYAANEFSGRLFFVTGLLMVMAAILFLPFGLIPHVGAAIYLGACWLTFTISLIGVFLLSFRYIGKL
ncbi:MAG TPA: SdpI family protein [Chthonomonadaceae bacterium]|nr:SdpI family protein [Chthonomonadaceae bacterium]